MGRAGAAFAGAGIALLQERLSIVLPICILKKQKASSTDCRRGFFEIVPETVLLNSTK
jgi:hypothetical protein